MEAAKSFERNGVRYRPGDALPSDLEKDIIAHYLRHGMVREGRVPAPAETKPAASSPRRTAQPAKSPKTLKPDETKGADTAQAVQQTTDATSQLPAETAADHATDSTASPAEGDPQDPVQQQLAGAEGA